MDDVRRPLPGQRHRDGAGRPKLVLGVVGLVVVVVLVATVGWLVIRGDDETATAPTSSVDPTDAAAQSRLLSQLPAGYPQGVCESAEPTDGAVAVMSCNQNADPGGPASATFTLVKDNAALEAAMNTVIAGSTTVECPGRIQSPGPWRRNATPQQVSGTVFCGYVGARPLVAWTDVAKLQLSEVRGGVNGPALTELYTWWSSHS